MKRISVLVRIHEQYFLLNLERYAYHSLAVFFTNIDINFVYMLTGALRKIHCLQCWYKLLQFISPHIHYIVQIQGLCPQPWKSCVGLANPGQKRSFT